MPPQKTTKGSKQKKKQQDTKKRELVTKGDPADQLEYAVVLKIYSTERIDVRCNDGKTRQGVVSGSMRKKIFVSPGDLVLVGKRDYQDAKCDLILKYFPHEVQQLVKMKEISNNFCSLEDNSKKGKAELEEAVTFDQSSDEEDEEGEYKKGPPKQQRNYDLPPSSSEDEYEEEETKQEEVPEVKPQSFAKPVAKDKRQKFEKQQEEEAEDDVDIDDI